LHAEPSVTTLEATTRKEIRTMTGRSDRGLQGRRKGRLDRRRFLAQAAALAGTAAVPALVRSAEGGGRLRAAVIGHTGRGDYGHDLHKAWLDVPGVEVVALADPDPTGRAAVAQELKDPKQYADYRKMLDEVKPDLVSIGTRWVDQHHDMLLAAAERGVKGVYMEKPLCRTLAEADAMVAACQKHKVKVALAFQTRYSPRLPVISELIRTGKIGDVLEFRARGKEGPRGGAEDLWVLGPHLMDLILHFAGPAKWCFASVLQGGRPITKQDVKPGNEGIALLAGNEVHATYRMDSGAMASFDSIRSARDEPRFGLWILGSKGIIDLGTNYIPWAYLLPHPSWSVPRGKKPWVEISSTGLGKPDPLAKLGPHHGNVEALKDLIAAVASDGKPRADIAAARAGLEMIVGVFESQRQGTPVSFPLSNRQDPLALL
jgi:predicted dehydrogenase